MSLREKIETEYKIAVKSKDKNKISTYRLILSGIKDLDITNRSGPNKKDTDDSDISKLLKKTEGLKNKAAKFISTLAFYDPRKKIELFSFGELAGEISIGKKGTRGFGYDPIFKLKNSNKTLAEVSFEERMKISHRSISTRKMITHLSEIYK